MAKKRRKYEDQAPLNEVRTMLREQPRAERQKLFDSLPRNTSMRQRGACR